MRDLTMVVSETQQKNDMKKESYFLTALVSLTITGCTKTDSDEHRFTVISYSNDRYVEQIGLVFRDNQSYKNYTVIGRDMDVIYFKDLDSGIIYSLWPRDGRIYKTPPPIADEPALLAGFLKAEEQNANAGKFRIKTTTESLLRSFRMTHGADNIQIK
jgi:hypothetical protein